jgi:hypothetical protein
MTCGWYSAPRLRARSRASSRIDGHVHPYRSTNDLASSGVLATLIPRNANSG